LLSLTQAGANLVDDIQKSFSQMNILLEDSLSDAEATKLTQLLYTIQKQIDTEQN
jgi:hypothetical protein